MNSRHYGEIPTKSDYLLAKARGGAHAGQPASTRTVSAYHEALSRAERLLGKELANVTEDDADFLMEAMEELAPATRNHTIAALRGFYRWAIGSGRYKGSNPFDSITSAKVNRKLPRILTREQIEELLEAISSEKYRLFFSLMYFGGLRIAEVAKLESRNVSNGGMLINGKGGKMRFVPLPKSVFEEVVEWIENQGRRKYVFGSDVGKAYSNDAMQSLVYAYEQFRKAVNIVGLPSDTRPHNLRHSSATHFHKAVGDLAKTQKFLGHSSPLTTTIYAQIADQEIAEASRNAFGD